MIRSKSGNTMAITTGTATAKIRISALYIPRRMGGEVEPEGGMAVGASPSKISSVVLIGLVLRGILVIGMIAMAETTMELRTRGYPDVPRILCVI